MVREKMMSFISKTVIRKIERYHSAGFISYSEIAVCSNCGREINPKKIPFFCPRCRKIIHGKEIGKPILQTVDDDINRTRRPF